MIKEGRKSIERNMGGLLHHFTFDVGEQSLDAGADLTSRLVIVAIIQLDEKQENK
jgi:hypothetical protein